MLLGIITTEEFINEPHNKDIINYGKKKNVDVCRFLSKDIDWENKIVNGFDSSGKRKKFRFPDVLYIRNGRPPISIGKKIMKSFVVMNSPDMIDMELDKLRTYEFIKKQGIGNKGKIRQPETLPYTKENTRKLFEKYKTLIFKPIHGMWGRGIIRVERNASYTLHYEKTEYDMNEKDLFEKINDIINKLNDEFIVQEAVNAKEYDGRVFDIRSFMLKDGKGEIIKGFTIMRIGAKKKVISNVHGGGDDVFEYKKILEQLYPSNHGEIIKNLESAFFKVAKIMNKLSVMGADIMLDVDGNAYLIEVNGCGPAIYLFTNIPKKVKQKLAEHMVDYAIHLYGQKYN